MSSTPNSKPRQSLFYRDLASPISITNRTASRFAPSGQTATASVLRLSGPDALSESPPPPPAFTLDDRLDFSPEPVPVSSPDSTPTPVRNYYSTPETKEKGMEMGSPSSPVNGVVLNNNNSANNKSGGGGSGMSMGLITLPPPREAVRPELNGRKDSHVVWSGAANEEEWVTVYGFSPRDTNLVLREFEKCGVILKHIPGPRDSNWMHMLYQNRYDAQKALGKNGMQLNSVLIVGVKPLDPMQRQYLNERIGSSTSNGAGFMIQPPKPTPDRSGLNTVATSSRPQFLQNGSSVSNDRHHATGTVASPAKSYVSKVMDLMFGF